MATGRQGLALIDERPILARLAVAINPFLKPGVVKLALRL
jgi:hypothetical protein